MNLYQVTTDEHQQYVQEIFYEYMSWQLDMFNLTYNFNLNKDDVQRIIDNDMRKMKQYLPPQGHLLLAEIDGNIAGIGGLRQLSEGIWEIKRIFVRPDYRGLAVGKTILQTLILIAKQHEASTLRLDSAKFLTTAHKLFYSLGFKNIERYEGAESPAEVQEYFLYLEMEL